MRSFALGLFLLGLVPSIFFHPYIGVLLFSWISFMSPHEMVWGFPKWIPLALITAVLTLVTWSGSKEPKRIEADATVWLILAFGAQISVTTLVAVNPDIATVMWSRTIKELLFVLVTIALTTNRIRFHALLWVMVISLGYYGLKGGLFSILHGGGARVYGPPTTAIYDNNDLGAGLVVALPLINYVRINSVDKWVRLTLLIVMASSVLSIVGTYSRGALLGLLAVSVFLWLQSSRKVVFGIFIMVTVISAIAFMPPEYFARVRTIQTYEDDRSAMSRIHIWGVAIKVAEDRPLTGGGFGVTESQAVIDRLEPHTEARAVHNIFLGVLAEHGYVGLAIWLALLFVGWRNSRLIVRTSMNRLDQQWANDFGRMCQVSLLGYCVVGSFGNYEYWDYYFTIIGLLAATRTMVRHAEPPLLSSAIPAVSSGPGDTRLCERRSGTRA